VRDWMSGCLYDVVEGPDGALYYSDAVAVHRVT
jgi:hypothetical protein